MKKTLFVLTLLCMSIMVYAQDNDEHLTFKGIPINGTRNSFVAKLKQKGFVFYSSDNGACILKGRFASYEDCDIYVKSLNDRDLVYAVSVFFPSCETWSAIESNYISLKQMLTTKYGNPVDCEEIFQNRHVDDDQTKFRLLCMDRCKYHTTFKTEKGSIILSIANKSFNEGMVTLSYFDATNHQKSMSEAIEDL